jgi:poly(A) polymerase
MKTDKKGQLKEKLTTGHETINRILWDNRLNPKAFTIGFLDRLSPTGLREKPLTEWDENGDIPWHRIRYIRCGEEVVWDREQRLDRFATDQLPTGAWQKESSRSGKPQAVFTPKPVFRHQSGEWVSVTEATAQASVAQVTLASYNVLSDRYETDPEDAAIRIPAILKQLRLCQASVICLQEVTALFLEQLLAQPWVAPYYVSANTRTFNADQGLLLVSVLPFSITEHSFSAQKNCLVGSFRINQQDLHVGVVHLTSNRGTNAMQSRQEQISVVSTYLHALAGDAVLAGDFNIRDKEELNVLRANNWMDCWELLHPDAEGYTFDPKTNPLARQHTLTGEPGRLDRVLIRSLGQHWVPRHMHIFGNEPVPDTDGRLFPSDHFGICTRMEWHSTQTKVSLQTEVQSLKPTYQSAIVVIPPEEVWPPIQAIRQVHDSKAKRWMPHVTLIYGFVAEDHFAKAADVISQVLQSLEPFDVTLTEFQTFAHRSSTTAWLKPEAEPLQAWQTLQKALQLLFPQCNEQSNRANGFTPHLSVGQFPDESNARKLLPAWKPVRFPVTYVALISRKGEEPFAVRYRIALGTGHIEKAGEYSFSAFLQEQMPELSSSEKETQKLVLSVIEEACTEVLGYPSTLHLLGSARLGVQTKGSDTDVVCLIPTGIVPTDFLSKVQKHLEGIYQTARLATDVQVPTLRLQLDGQRVDLLCANHSFFPGGLEQVQEEDWRNFDDKSWQAVSGCLEADKIAQIVENHVSPEEFRQLVRTVRLWARKRRISGNGWGYPGNFSWTLLAAWSCTLVSKKQKPGTLLALLEHFFRTLHAHDWSQPVSLTDEGKHYLVRKQRDWMPVITSVKPHFNSARNLTRSTFHIIQSELDRACQLMPSDWETVFEELLIPGHLLLELQVVCTNAEDVSEVCGWIEGNLVALLINLEKANVTIRPYPGFAINATVATLFIGWISPDLADKYRQRLVVEEFLQRFDSWPQRPANSQLTYIEL